MGKRAGGKIKAKLRRSTLAPDQLSAFQAFSQVVFSDGAIDAKSKQLIAVAVAHVTQCPYCIAGHTRAAAIAGATPQQIMAADWIAAEMRAGAAVARSRHALQALNGTGE